MVINKQVERVIRSLFMSELDQEIEANCIRELSEWHKYVVTMFYDQL